MESPLNAKALLDRLHHFYMKRYSGTVYFECDAGPVSFSMKKGDIITVRSPHFDQGNGFMGLLTGDISKYSTSQVVDESLGHEVTSSMEMILFEMAAGMDVKVNKVLNNVRKTGKLPPEITRTVVVPYEPEAEQPQQQIYLLEEGETVVGRSASADVIVQEPTMSRRHAMIRISNHTATVENISTANGTFVNRKLTDFSPLEEGNLLSLGKTMFKFMWSDCGRGILFRLNEEKISPEDMATYKIPS